MIELIMPAMRRDKALLVLEDLNKQSVAIDRLVIIDNANCLNFISFKGYGFEVKRVRHGVNIGTNAAWNYMWDTEADFVGVVGDDYRIDPDCIEGLMNKLQAGNVHAVTATIFKDRPVNFKDKSSFNAL